MPETQHIAPDVRGTFERFEMELKVLQQQVNQDLRLYDLSRNQLEDRDNQYRHQAHLWKGMVFFLMGLCVVFFFAPSPGTRGAFLMMVATLVLTMALMAAWLFQA